jgi:hypothetical protein
METAEFVFRSWISNWTRLPLYCLSPVRPANAPDQMPVLCLYPTKRESSPSPGGNVKFVLKVALFVLLLPGQWMLAAMFATRTPS